MILEKSINGSVTVLDFLTVVLVLFLAISVAKGVSVYLRKFLKQKVSRESSETIVKVLYYLIIIAAAISVFRTFGVKISGLLVAAGVIGLAVGFACQDFLGNLISGPFLIFEKRIRIGMWVSIEGTEGVVEDIGILSTTLKTSDGQVVTVPNQKVFSATIANFGFEYKVTIRHSQDVDKAIRVIKDLIKEHPLSVISSEPQVSMDKAKDAAANIIVRIWAPATQGFEAKTALLRKIKEAMEKEGIQVASSEHVV